MNWNDMNRRVKEIEQKVLDSWDFSRLAEDALSPKEFEEYYKLRRDMETASK